MYDRFARETVEMRGALDLLSAQLQTSQDKGKFQVADLEKKLAEMHSRVDTAVVNRINSLDGALRQEMSERVSVIQEVLDTGTHNSERWCQLQAKFDELLIEVRKGNGPRASGSGAVNPTGSARGDPQTPHS